MKNAFNSYRRYMKSDELIASLQASIARIEHLSSIGEHAQAQALQARVQSILQRHIALHAGIAVGQVAITVGLYKLIAPVAIAAKLATAVGAFAVAYTATAPAGRVVNGQTSRAISSAVADLESELLALGV